MADMIIVELLPGTVGDGQSQTGASTLEIGLDHDFSRISWKLDTPILSRLGTDHRLKSHGHAEGVLARSGENAGGSGWFRDPALVHHNSSL